MMTDDPTLLALLGPSARPVDDVPARVSTTAHGFAPASLAERLGAGAARIRTAVPLSSGLRVDLIDADPAVFVLAEQDVVAAIAGALVSMDDLLIVDTGTERAILEMVGGYLLVAAQGAIQVYPLPRLAGAEFPESVVLGSTLPAPPVDLWSAGQAPWLIGAAHRLASSPRNFERAAAAGVLARLAWHPDDAASPTVASVRGWVGAIEQELWSSVARDAAAEALALAALIDDLTTDGGVLQDAFLRRDALAGVALVLRFAGEAGLEAALAAVDQCAAEATTSLGEMAADADDWLEDYRGAVSWQEPEAWWPLL